LVEFLRKAVEQTDAKNKGTYLFNLYYFFTGIFSEALLKTLFMPINNQFQITSTEFGHKGHIPAKVYL
jgi:hypothetical protein